ncbi:conserved Plasmodium protein, unknown function [Plasmodium malariae]|uniref:Uncharacterized protein n=1 Tax=Plasmodium malariae TaxID=5858 RepID=A0A1A8W500_PLAMA|nr:conserved Plasmodium protein, unknown function [Plasmodium malariae]
MQNAWDKINKDMQNIHLVILTEDDNIYFNKGFNPIEGYVSISLNSEEKEKEKTVKVKNILYEETVNNINVFNSFINSEKVHLLIYAYKINYYTSEKKKLFLLDFIYMSKYIFLILTKFLNINLIDKREFTSMNKQHKYKEDQINYVENNYNCNNNNAGQNEKQKIKENDRGNYTINVEEKGSAMIITRETNNIYVEHEEAQYYVHLNDKENPLGTDLRNNENLKNKGENGKDSCTQNIHTEENKLRNSSKLSDDNMQEDFSIKNETKIYFKNIINTIKEENNVKINLLNDKIRYLQGGIDKNNELIINYKKLTVDVEKYQSEIKDKNKIIEEMTRSNNTLQYYMNSLQLKLVDRNKFNED